MARWTEFDMVRCSRRMQQNMEWWIRWCCLHRYGSNGRLHFGWRNSSQCRLMVEGKNFVSRSKTFTDSSSPILQTGTSTFQLGGSLPICQQLPSEYFHDFQAPIILLWTEISIFNPDSTLSEQDLPMQTGLA